MSCDLITVPDFIPEVLGAAGIDFDELLRRAGIAARPFHNGRMRVTTVQFFALWNAVEDWGVPANFGLRMASSVDVHQFDVASIAALHSANLGEALTKLARYKRLTCPEEISVAPTGEEAHVRFTWLGATSNVPSLTIDAAFAWLHRLVATGTGAVVTPLRIELTRRPTQEHVLREHFGCELRFNAPHDILVFSKDVLRVPFRTHYPDMLDLIVPGLESALKERVAATSLTTHVRARLLAGMRGQRPAIDQVAGELCVSPRTLQRRLEQEGTSYQRLLDEVRRETACRLLSGTDLDAGEIAFVLGFEELNSFTRAFQGWEGTTPVRWRSSRARLSAPHERH